MNKELKKSLYFGLAAVSFLGAAGFASSNASAKTYARVTSNRLMTSEPGQRNVVTNGTNALYTKAGTLRGARLVASKATLAQLGNSNSSQKYFRAYRVATTNRGSVYYKVVSFDQQYRGWIYGGTSTAAFGGGITTTDTMTSAALPSSTTGYSLVDINKNTLWESPKWSQYLAKQSDMSGYKAGDTFKIIGAATKSREGWLYYQVVDENNANVTGWVFADGLKQTTPTTVGSVTINYDNAAGQVVGTAKWDIPSSAVKTGATVATGSKLGDVLNNISDLWTAATAKVPAGYAISSNTGALSPANVTVGGSFSVQVIPVANAQKVEFFSIKSGQALVGVTNPTLTTADQTLLSGKTGDKIPSSVWTNATFKAGGNLYSIANPNGGSFVFDAETTAARNTTFDGTVTLFYK